MVLHKHGDRLYAGVQNVIADHLLAVTNDFIRPAFPLRGDSGDSGGGGGGGTAPDVQQQRQQPIQELDLLGALDFLKTVKLAWEDHSTCMIMIRDILLYMVSQVLIIFFLILTREK